MSDNYLHTSTGNTDTVGQRVLPTLIDILGTHVTNKGDDTALIFLSDGENQDAPITYRELHDKAMRFAAGIRKYADRGDRVILLFQSSYEFVIAFLGCMIAGVISIPLPMPGKRANEWSRLGNILVNSEAKFVVTYEKAQKRLLQNAERNLVFLKLNVHLYENLIQTIALPLEPIQGSDTTFLQYTSGSTGEPKGVMLTHDNLIENQILIEKGCRNYGRCVYFSWLPLFHDMGLIGNLVQSIYIGQPFVFMAPNAFLQKPIRWLKAITDYQVRVSGGPNFAYDLCVERINEENKIGLDLTSWEVAFNGAEPIRAHTLKRFKESFKSCGFKEDAFYPCYGSAESTLIISGAETNTTPVYRNVDRDIYEKNTIEVLDNPVKHKSIMLVSSGKPLIKDSVVIIDPETKTRLPDLSVGEIWLTSPCNAVGYWNNPKESAKAFDNRINGDEDNNKYLNTGDLGFLEGDNIYITGRAKDLLIFNGRNIYPQDIEVCSESSHLALKTGRCVATSSYIDGRERLILVHELERFYAKRTCYQALIERIRIAVYKEFVLPVYAVALVAPSTIPITSSGKVRRQLCRKQYENNELNLTAHWAENMESIQNIESQIGAI